MGDLRWKRAGDDGGQPALFDTEELVQRHVGRGEYAGLEFLHVNARRIINEVPAASRLPFRYTINAYRGCSHACSYCLEGGTPVLLADGSTRPIADLTPGDEVYGTVARGAYRRLVRTVVLDHWSTLKPAHRVILEDGTELIASGDHRFLTDRGWKQVTGREQGRERRPHLTPNNKLMGFGGFAPAPDKGTEYRTGYLCGILRGDGHLGHYVYPRPGRRLAPVHRFRLALVDLQALRRARRYLSELGVATQEWLFQKASGERRAMRAIRAQSRAAVSTIEAVIAWPTTASVEWTKGFLAGIFDAEGSCSGSLRIANCDDVIVARTAAALSSLNFRFAIERPAARPEMHYVRLLGGVCEQLRFFHGTDPAISRKRDLQGLALKTKARLRLVAVEPVGQCRLFDITTGTGDFIANGVVSHNCFARPTHEYLGLGAGEDFERKLVVKVNAVERLRAELAARRWRGEPIAMGTNTDPYQRCEGKYHLTRGIVEVLGAARNPFSILTKSTLVLRDLQRLAAAARRTDVRVNLSIGTLDEAVWRATEPGTPHPRRRVEAVSRLNRAGVPCGVLVAPVLPGISDSPEQLREVVTACVEAGAVSVSAIALHLRPGVREHFLGWLTENRPELVPDYERRYRRAYLPGADQRALADQVSALVEEARGRSVPATTARAVNDDPPPLAPEPPAAVQLGLELPSRR